jgi:hypothetical protein
MDWVPIDINNQMITPYNLQISELNSKDTIWPAGYKNEEYYNLDRKPSFPYYHFPKMITGIMIQLDPDRLITTRKVYSFF